jgi:hypothetical protein
MTALAARQEKLMAEVAHLSGTLWDLTHRVSQAEDYIKAKKEAVADVTAADTQGKWMFRAALSTAVVSFVGVVVLAVVQVVQG